MRPLAVCLGVVAWSVAGAAAPSITGAGPNPINAGGPFFPLSIVGTGFVNGSVAHWGTAVLTTEYLGPTQLQAEVGAEMRMIAGAYPLTVINPGGVTSSPYQMVVLPVLASVTPSAVVAGSQDLTVQLKGIGFQSKVLPQISTSAGPVNLAWTLVDSGAITAVIPASALAEAREATIQVIDTQSGGVSSQVWFSVRGSPAISSLAPNPVDAGGVYFLLSINGSGFTVGVQVHWPDGSELGTSYVSPTQVRAAITPDLRTLAGGFALTVNDPVTGITSNAYSFVVSPVLFSISPSSAATRGPPLTITATGVGFTGSTVLSMTLAGIQTALPTTYVNSTTLTGVVPASALAGSGNITIQVNDTAGGGHSLTQTLTVSPGVPILNSLSPSAVTAGTGGFALTVTGSNFAPGAAVLWNGSALPATGSGSTQLTATVPSALVQSAGTASVAVSNGGGVQSAAATFTIRLPAPLLTGLTPASAIAGSGALTLTVSTNCGSGCTVQWNGAPIATSSANAASVTATVPANLLAAAGTAFIRLVNSDGTASNTATFLIYPAAAVLTSVSPSAVTAGASAVTLTVNGSGFAAGATVLWNGAPLITSLASPTQLTATVPAGLMNGILAAAIAVSNPGGAVSNSLTVMVNAPGPAIASLSPATVAVGSGPFTLTVTGQNFAVNCIVRWNGTPLFTVLADATHATAQVPSNLLGTAGTAAITLANPSGQESNAATFTITAAAATIAAIAPSSAAAGSPAITLTVSGTNFPAGSAVLWNGSVLATTYVSGTTLKANVPAALLASAGLASVSVSSPGAAAPLSALVFTIGVPIPATTTAAIVNAGSSTGTIAPGSLISIYGTNLAAGTMAATIMPLPASLNGTSVTINGLAAPLIFVSSGQINAQVPYETSTGNATLTIGVAGLKSAPVTFAVQSVAPGLLPVVLNCADGSLNSRQAPVGPGQYITVWVTGQGALDHAIATGDAAPADPIAQPLAEVRAQLGGQDTAVSFAGMAPGLAGLLQVNLVVPSSASAGDQPLVVTVGGAASNALIVSVGTAQ